MDTITRTETIIIMTSVLTLFLGLFLLLKIDISFKKWTVQKEMLQKKIEHLYSLVTILNNGSNSPMHKLIFLQIYKTDPENLNKDLHTDFELLKKKIISTYTQIQKDTSESLKNATDFHEKMKLKKQLSEIQNILNLSSIINRQSPNEYIKTVLSEINHSMIQLLENNHNV